MFLIRSHHPLPDFRLPATQPSPMINELWPAAPNTCEKNSVHGNLASLHYWQALPDETPNAIVSLLEQHGLDCLPNMASVLKRHLQELPHSISGLSFTQRLALDVLEKQSKQISISKWFQLYQKIEPLPYLGDVMFYALILPLATNERPLVAIDSPEKSWWEQQVCITQHGIHCLNGQVKFAQQYWVGGIQNNEKSRWEWDHIQLSSLSNTQC